MVHSKRQSIWGINPDQPSLKFNLLKKRVDLETYQQQCSMISAYLLHPLFGAARLKCNGNGVSFFKNTKNKEKSPLLFEK